MFRGGAEGPKQEAVAWCPSAGVKRYGWVGPLLRADSCRFYAESAGAVSPDTPRAYWLGLHQLQSFVGSVFIPLLRRVRSNCFGEACETRPIGLSWFYSTPPMLVVNAFL